MLIRIFTDVRSGAWIKVILCSVTPIGDFGPAQEVLREQGPTADIRKINQWMKDYAARVGLPTLREIALKYLSAYGV